MYFMLETFCPIEFHNVILSYVKNYVPLFILNLLPERIWFLLIPHITENDDQPSLHSQVQSSLSNPSLNFIL